MAVVGLKMIFFDTGSISFVMGRVGDILKAFPVVVVAFDCFRNGAGSRPERVTWADPCLWP